MSENLDIILIGTSHKTSTVSERSILQLDRKELSYCLKLISAYTGVASVMILSTCNRIEFYLETSPEMNGFDTIRKFYIDYKGRDIAELSHIFYNLHGYDVCNHLFRVSAGVESVVLGEHQIQGQIKEAYSIACQAKTLGAVFHKLCHAAFRTGKRARAETSICAGRQSVGGVAAQILICSLNRNAPIAIAGVNENTKILATRLYEAGFKNFIFINRTLSKAEMLAEQFGGSAEPLANMESALRKSDALFSCTGAKEYIISSDTVERIYSEGCCPSIIIDMAVPRDIDTSNVEDKITVYDIGSLKEYLLKNNDGRQECLPQVMHIIDEEMSLFRAWSDNRDNEILRPFAETFEHTRRQVLDEYGDKLSGIDYELADKLTHSLVHRLQSVFMKALVTTARPD